MAGFIVASGKQPRDEVEAAFGKIRHRGSYAHGILESHGVIMAQNYLRADGVPSDGSVEIPVRSISDAQWRICYDGQIGNWERLAQMHGVRRGPFQEELLILHLYHRYGRSIFEYLTDALFAFVISDGRDLFAARDLLGIKTLYYGRKNRTLYFASEIKALIELTEDIHEFPPGYYMERDGRLTPFARLPEAPPHALQSDPNRIAGDIRDIIRRSVRSRMDFRMSTGSLLSGGLDSSVIAFLASEAYREKFGEDAKLKTFAVGVGEASDIKSARDLARWIRTDHHELIVDLEEILRVLPEIIYYLESFDPSLVRSSVSNYLISRHAGERGIQVLLSGEGGDEIFCGYTYLKEFPLHELFARQMECIGCLHNNASLRLDRMNQCHGLRVVAPLISGELLSYAMTIPPEYKMRQEHGQRTEKWIFRKAFESALPEGTVWRTKEEFSQGSGSASVLPEYFEGIISDKELIQAQAEYGMIRSKEELYYFRVFTKHFGAGNAIDIVGQWAPV